MLTQRQLTEDLIAGDLRNHGHRALGPILRITSMPITKIEAFKQEFPWIEKHVGEGPIYQVYVSRMEPNILRHAPYYTRCVDGAEKLWLLDESGNLVIHKKLITHRKYWLFGPVVTTNQEISGKVEQWSTVTEKLDALDESANRVHFTLSYYKPIGVVIVYKSPKDVSIIRAVKQQCSVDWTAFYPKK